MPKGSEELTRARREEIVNACAALYAAKSFREITLREIGEKTSFTRTSIYNYFRTREEIFLALLQREYQDWIDDLQALLDQGGPRTADAFAEALAGMLQKRTLLLKLLSMDLYEIEDNTGLEALVAFKRVYARLLETLCRCLRRLDPALPQADAQRFLYALCAFLFGVYPHVAPTEKQRQAMDRAGVPYPRGITVYAMVSEFVARQLRGFGVGPHSAG